MMSGTVPYGAADAFDDFLLARLDAAAAPAGWPRGATCQFPSSPGNHVAIGGKKKIATNTIRPNRMYGTLAA
jgi:hypothetical protein